MKEDGYKNGGNEYIICLFFKVFTNVYQNSVQQVILSPDDMDNWPSHQKYILY